MVNVSGSDSIVEINTKGYGDNPIVIQSATAGAAVTARGVYADLLRVGSRKGVLGRVLPLSGDCLLIFYGSVVFNAYT